MWWVSKNAFDKFTSNVAEDMSVHASKIGNLQDEVRRLSDGINDFDDILFPEQDGEVVDRLEDVETEAAIARKDAVEAKGLASSLAKARDGDLAAIQKWCEDIFARLDSLQKQVQCGITGHKWSDGFLVECPALAGMPGDNKYSFVCGQCGAIYKKAESQLNPFERKLAGLETRPSKKNKEKTR